MNVNRLWDSVGPQNGSLERHVRPKQLQKSSPPSGSDRPGADVDAIWRRKLPKNAFSWIFVRLVVDFKRMLDNCGWFFGAIFQIPYNV